MIGDVPELGRVVRYAAAAARRAAVAGATLGLRQGQIGVLIGPSGCGKTSLLRAVAGLERCDAGRIAWTASCSATPPVHLPPRRAASAWCSRTTRCFRT
jgi:iron(III) transport system ATP-binding protein